MKTKELMALKPDKHALLIMAEKKRGEMKMISQCNLLTTDQLKGRMMIETGKKVG